MLLAITPQSSRVICSSCRRSLISLRERRFATTTNTSSSPEIYDVVTVGGGPVGLALIAAIKSLPATAHLRCALIESQDLSKSRSWSLPPDRYSNRASSLTPTNVSFLDQIGAWRHVDQSRIQPYDEMQVWDAGHDSSIRFDWKSEAIRYNAPLRTIATMTENTNLTKGILDRLSELDADGCLMSGTSVSSITNGQDDLESHNMSSWPVINLKPTSSSPSDAPTSIAARLLIGADGFNSPVRSFAGINSHGWDYDRHGVVATLTVKPQDEHLFNESPSFEDMLSEDNNHDRPSNRATAFQRFLPSLGGPIAVLPLPNNHASLVWSTTPQIAAYLKGLSPSSFVATVNAALRLSQTDIKYMLSLPSTPSDSDSIPTQSQHQEEFSWRMQHTHPQSTTLTPPTIMSVQEGTVASFPLRMRHATTLTGPHVALAGDAAHTIHPLAGQGLNLGLADAAALASTIEYAVEHGMDLGHPMTLERYATQRFGKGLVMAGGVDAMNWIYSLGGANGLIGDGVLGSVVSRARGLGMKIVDQGWIPGLKEFVMKRAD